MNQMLQTIQDALGPVASSTLGHALIGVAILLIGLFVVKLITGVFEKLLTSVAFFKEHNLLGPIVSLARAILTIFVLMAVLQHFGLTDVLSPLKNMVDQFLAAVPRIIGASVVAYAGWVIAKIVSELVGVGLSRVDEQLALKSGNEDLKVSGFGSAFIFGGILLPIIVAALGVLNIPSITVPASGMINELMAAVPNIVGAGIILLVTYFVAKFVVYMLTGLLDGMGVNELPSKMGIDSLFSDTFTANKLVGSSVMFFSMLTATTAAINTLGIEVISNIFAKVLEFGGGILVGGVILVIGNFLSNLAHQKLTESGSAGIANIARVAILGLVLAMGLRSMGLADNIVNMAFGFTIGAVAVATALAFGLGGRDAAKSVADNWASKITKK
ncbi:mechanosensitive ion channel [Arenicella sp. 4NH20-0111]|uniref:mechanosensitive ion channel n=1 Tax=Arenicella sp. 4NH20-0111 TaxID=3127648 RepID=UPI0031053317